MSNTVTLTDNRNVKSPVFLYKSEMSITDGPSVPSRTLNS